MQKKNSCDILLIQCPPWDIAMPPLGIAYLAASMKKNGLKVSVFDLNIELYAMVSRDLKYLWEQRSFDWWVERDMFENTKTSIEKLVFESFQRIFSELEVPVVGISVSFTSIRFASEVIKMIKDIRSDIRVVIGGWGTVTEHMRGLFPKDLVDCFVVAEGEETLREVLEYFKGHKTGVIPGAIFPKHSFSEFVPRPPVTDLNMLPWPTFSEFNLDRYMYEILPLMSSRGCISRCSFCNDWPLSRPYRAYRAAGIFEQISYHVKNNGRTVFSFKDLLCNGNLKELNDLAERIINSGLSINWDSQAISYGGMTRELLCKLKKAGCGTLIYGVETFSNNVLKKMKKLFTAEVAERVIQDTHRAGIRVMINIIVGFPGETEDDLSQTLEAIKRNSKYISQVAAVSVCLVNNDSELDKNASDYGIVLPEDCGIRAKKWVGDGGNTYDVRRRRAEAVINLLGELGISHDTQTI